MTQFANIPRILYLDGWKYLFIIDDRNKEEKEEKEKKEEEEQKRLISRAVRRTRFSQGNGKL